MVNVANTTLKSTGQNVVLMFMLVWVSRRRQYIVCSLRSDLILSRDKLLASGLRDCLLSKQYWVERSNLWQIAHAISRSRRLDFAHSCLQLEAHSEVPLTEVKLGKVGVKCLLSRTTALQTSLGQS